MMDIHGPNFGSPRMETGTSSSVEGDVHDADGHAPVVSSPPEKDISSNGTRDSGGRTRNEVEHIENDEHGGSWFDDFTDDSGIERMINCTLWNSRISPEPTDTYEVWHYTEWSSRKMMEIVNTADEDLEDYPIHFAIPMLTGMRPDFDDIRFTYFNEYIMNEVPLSYWIEERHTGEEAGVWINVTKIPANGSSLIFLYYGNPLATDESDGDATFIFFDDFLGTSLNRSKWMEPTAGSRVSHSVTDGALYFHVYNAYNIGMNCTMKEHLDIDGHMIEARQRMQLQGTFSGNAHNDATGMTVAHRGGNWLRRFGRSKKDNSLLKYATSSTNTIWRQGVWNGALTGFHAVGFGKHDDTVMLYEDRNHVNTIQDTGISESEYKTKIILSVGGYDGNGWGELWTDWFRIRKQVIPEPIPDFLPLEGAVYSKIISLPASMKWDMLSLDTADFNDPHIAVTVINADTNGTIPAYDDISGKNIDLSGLNDLEVSAIRLHARLKGTENSIPTIYSWGVEWVTDDAWRDSFIGDGKTDRMLCVDEHTVGLWHFDEGRGNLLRDSSGNGNHGTVSGASWCDGKLNGGLQFEGVGDYVEIPDNNGFSIDSTGKMTVEFWFRTGNDVTRWQTLIAKGGQNSGGPWEWNIVLKDGFLRAFICDSAGGTIRGEYVPVRTNKWYHTAVIFNGDTDTDEIDIYLNAIKSNTLFKSAPRTYSNTNGNFGFGRGMALQEWRFFNGILDEVRISDVARSPEEIRHSAFQDLNLSGGQVQLPNARSSSGMCSVASWGFDEGTGDTATDESGNGNHGTLYNMNASHRVPGIEGSGLKFDGIDDHVRVEDDDFIRTRSTMTLSFWERVDGFTGSGDEQFGRFIFKLDDNGNNYQVFHSTSSPYRIYAQFEISGAIYGAQTQYVHDAGTWYHIEVTLENAVVEIYVDGADTEASSYDYANINPGSNDLYIGGWFNDSSDKRFFNGVIDEVEIFACVPEPDGSPLPHGSYQHSASSRSTDIELPYKMTWNVFHASRRVPENTYLNISIHDAGSHEILFQDNNATDEAIIDISAINGTEHHSLYIRAFLQSNRTRTPVLLDWSVLFTVSDVNDPMPPVARGGGNITVDQHETVRFNASSSTDNIGIVGYEWSFVYGEAEFRLKGLTSEFIFDDVGKYDITLKVDDGAGNFDTDIFFVTVRDITSPVADAGPDIIIDQNASAEFNARASYDNVGITDLEWLIELNNGTVNLAGEIVSFIFDVPGNYIVTLNVSDAEGNTARDILIVTVRDTIPPLALAGPDIVVLRGLDVQFDGNRSSDNVGISNYTWLFSHDGSMEILGGMRTNIRFNVSGEINVTLTVSDEAGNIDRDFLIVTVLADEEGSPEDSDGDGYNDTYENESGSDPYDGNSTPVDRDGDGYTNAEEEGSGSNPDNARSTPLDWDGDGVVNERDAYPYDASRWSRGPERDYRYILLYAGLSLVLLLVSILVYTRIKGKAVLGNGIRRKIIEYVINNPGKHYSDVLRQLDVSRGTLTHHLRRLEEENLIIVRKDGKFKYLYPPGLVDNNSSLTPGERRVYDSIRVVPGSTVKEVAEKVGKSKRTIYHHLDNLSVKGRVFSERDNGEHQWYASEERG